MVSSCRPVAPARRTTPRRWGRRLVLADQHRPYQFFLRLSLWDGPAAGIQGPPSIAGLSERRGDVIPLELELDGFGCAGPPSHSSSGKWDVSLIGSYVRDRTSAMYG